MKWFVRAEECFSIKNLFLFNINSTIINEIETDQEENYWKYRSYEQISQILREKYSIPFDAFVGLYTRQELMIAARFAWLLYWIGYEQIGIIIGKIEPNLSTNYRGQSFDLPKCPLRPTVRLTCDDLFEEFLSPTTTMKLLDVRTYEEYSGRITGYSYVRRSGRIPNFDFDPLDGIYGRINGTISWNELEDYFRLISRYESNFKRLVYMCGTGWRASLAAIFAEEFNLAETITVLDSGWFEWSERFVL